MRVMAITYNSRKEICGDHPLQKVKLEGENDEEYKALATTINEGLPARKELLNLKIASFGITGTISLFVDGGIVLFGCRILIPKSMHALVLSQLHTSHQGQQGTRRHARQVVFWPNTTSDIRNIVRNCHQCSSYLPSYQSKALMQDIHQRRPF